jgi:signal transduction histidine kinase
MANIYARNSHWKWYLAAGGIAIIIISLLYTRYLAGRLEERETQQARLWAEAQRSMARMGADTLEFFHCDLTLPAQVLVLNNTIPVVMVNREGAIQDALNVDGSEGEKVNIPKVQAELERMRKRGVDSIEMAGNPDLYVKVYYSHSKLLDLIKWYPFVQLGLIMAFIAFGYLGFNAARRAEENQVWLGMAKETAHQLGTPITAILGWLETLKAVNEDRPDTQEMLDELGKDVNRLELVADRFSKIGAMPELTPVNLYEQLEQNRIYMQRRAPRKVTFDFPAPADNPPAMAGINPPIFDWVLENLLRNAIDALEGGVGNISARVYSEGHYHCIDISDTGKGIPANKFKTVFKPGYSTKTRGWGLGLSLSKRIIEQYHSGKIFVKKSELGKGTTFTIKLLKRP